ncbi:MAG: Periplasmic serine endoprotease DegP [Alphaproteobacteria bacterium MarineAlpha2_Bin1]|nr:MAG: Periplasmic serine endoprotease DegP [Alphaproteobacteria bacterium MarineAlpha2_Bin1]
MKTILNNKLHLSIFSTRNYFYFLLIVFFSLLHFSDTSYSAGRPDSFADLAAKLKPSVVNVSTTHDISSPHSFGEMPKAPPGSPFEEFFRDFFEKQQENGNPMPRRRTQSLGSGFIISETGIVITNNHVIADADEIKVILDDKRVFNANLIGRDRKTDIAVLQIKNKNKIKFPFVKWGNSETSRVGDWVIAIGNPFGLGGSVTAGIISARGRNIGSGPYDNFIQTDASINRGNSGGPMFDLEGEVIGINTAIFSPSGGSVGIGFAIPSNLANRVVDQIIKFGKTQRGWLGVQIQTVSEEIAESLSLNEPKGALISRISKDGPADKAGLLPGDIILDFDGKNVDEMRQLPRIVADTDIGKKVKVTVWRKGASKQFNVIVGELVETINTKVSKKVENKSMDILGMTLSTITERDKSTLKLNDNVKGIIVKSIKAQGSSAQRGIRVGDIIVEANQISLSTPKQFSDILKSLKKDGKKTVLLMIDRSGDRRFVGIRIE